MAILRGLGWLLVFVAAVLGVYEAMDFVDSGDRTMSPLGELWRRLHPSSLETLQSLVAGNLADDVWTSVAQPVLDQPAIALVGGLALFCLVVGYVFRRRDDDSPVRRRRRRR